MDFKTDNHCFFIHTFGTKMNNSRKFQGKVKFNLYQMIRLRCDDILLYRNVQSK